MPKQAKQTGVALAVQSCHNSLHWFVPQLDKFPRSRKFTLGQKLELGLLDVLAKLIEAHYQNRGRKRLLEECNVQLTVLRHLWRLAFELQVIAQKQHVHGSKLLVDVGKQIGGWLKQLNESNSASRQS